jgi:uncharacterized RDD family membrane protein YckC
MSTTSLWKHFAAFVYDLFPIVGVFFITSLVVLIIRGGNPVERYSLWFSLLLLIEFSGYYIYSWKIGGQTLGMRAWKMKIIPRNNNQSTLTWTQASARFLVGILSTAFLGLGLFWKLFNPKHESWMDWVSQSKTINHENNY